jgi:hypothetical protein
VSQNIAPVKTFTCDACSRRQLSRESVRHGYWRDASRAFDPFG